MPTFIIGAVIIQTKIMKMRWGCIKNKNTKVVSFSVYIFNSSPRIISPVLCFYRDARKQADLVMVQIESQALQRYLLEATLLELISDIAVDVHTSVSLEKKETLLTKKRGLETRTLSRYFHR